MFLSRWIFVVSLMAVALVQGCATASPEPDLHSLAYRRTSEQRSAVELDEPTTLALATWALPFARVASHAYCSFLPGKSGVKADQELCSTMPTLEATNWQLLYDSREILEGDEMQIGLEFLAYGRAGTDGKADIIIGFRGTDFWSASDWRANLRWITRFLPLGTPDQYTVVHRHAAQMVDLALQRVHERQPEAKGHNIYTTGHSLGGGLAQLLAYSDQRVLGAVVFDPSPVTGYSTEVSNAQVNCSARVVRIYERGEGLEYIRGFLRRFYALSTNISELSFDVIHAHGNPVANHSITAFRSGLEARTGIKPQEIVPVSGLAGKPDCDCYRLRRPADTSDDANMCRAP